MEDIEIDDDRFMSFCVKFKYLYLGSYFVPELNDTADITERISQTRKLLFGSMKKQLCLRRFTEIDQHGDEKLNTSYSFHRAHSRISADTERNTNDF
jgi:hypothetical protein